MGIDVVVGIEGKGSLRFLLCVVFKSSNEVNNIIIFQKVKK